jgi:hypothetical protein
VLKAFLKGASEYEDPLFFSADHEIQNCRDGFRNIKEDSALLDSLITNIKWRATSRPEDEFICLANLLGRDIAEVMSFSYTDKMKWLFSSLERVSAPIIFHDRPRVEELGYRWIPKSLLNTGNALQIRGDSQRVKPSPGGLTVNYPGLLLFPDQSFYRSETHSPVFLTGNDISRAYVIEVGEQEGVEQNLLPRMCYQGHQLALIFEDFEDRSMEYVNMAHAIIVTITDEKQDVMVARIEYPVLFRKISRGAIPSHVCYANAKALPRNQTWQVG